MAPVRSVGPEGVAVELHGGGLLTAHVVPDGVAAGSEVIVGLRPENLRPTEGELGFKARVEVIERLGNETMVYASLPGGETVVFQDRRASRMASGQTVQVGADPMECHLFRKDGTAFRRTGQALAHALEA